MVVSDHGMLSVDVEHKKDTQLIDMEKIVDQDDVEVMLDRGSTAFLIPKEGRLDKVFEQVMLLVCSCRWSCLGVRRAETGEQEGPTSVQEGQNTDQISHQAQCAHGTDFAGRREGILRPWCK